MVKRKEDAWKEVLGARDEDTRERCLERLKGAFIKITRRSKNNLEGR